jgi:hypothetical protein
LTLVLLLTFLILIRFSPVMLAISGWLIAS